MVFIRFFAVTVLIGSFLSISTGSIAFQKKPPSQIRKTKVISTPTPTPIPLGSLSIDVGLIKGNGDVKKIARVEFVLMTKSLYDILQSVNYAAYLSSGQRNNVEGLIGWYFSKIHLGDRAKETDRLEILKVQKELKIYTVQSVKTDFNGQAKFENIEPGEYYILGGDIFLGLTEYVWTPKIKIKSGLNSLILDSDNATKL